MGTSWKGHSSPLFLAHVYCGQMPLLSTCLVLCVVSSSGSTRPLAQKCKEKRAERFDLAFIKLCCRSSEIWPRTRLWSDASASERSADWQMKLTLKHELWKSALFMTNYRESTLLRVHIPAKATFRRLPPALAAPEPWPCAPGCGLRPRPAFRFIVRKTLTYLRRAYVSVHRYSLEVFLWAG